MDNQNQNDCKQINSTNHEGSEPSSTNGSDHKDDGVVYVTSYSGLHGSASLGKIIFWLYAIAFIAIGSSFIIPVYEYANLVSTLSVSLASLAALMFAVYIGTVVNNNSKGAVKGSGTLRALAVLITAVIGGLGGAFIALVIFIISSQRACSLSSSKCM